MRFVDEKLYYVGGVVRDEILGIPSFDTDFCYEGNAIKFAQKENLNIIKENQDFGTVRVIINKQEIDIASTRCESYPKVGHLPLVNNIGCSLKDDLSRRDFTINALAKNTVTGEITDYFNGITDLKNKKLRVLHDKSFIEDPSRIIRGLKFSVRFGFELDVHTKALQEDYLANINYDLSFHRIKKELKETFNLNKKIAYDNFIDQGIYKLLGVGQEVCNYEIEEKLIEKLTPKHIWLIYLGCFNLSNFELTSEEKLIIDSYQSIKNQIPNDDYETYKLFNNIPLESLLIYAFSVNKEIILRYLGKLKNINLEITGCDLKALGIKEGVIYKEIFDFVMKEKINKQLLSKNEEIQLVKERFGNHISL